MAQYRDERDPRGRFDEQRDRAARERGERGFFERAGDEISSWFGDDEAERRREMDERSGRGYRASGRDDPRDQGRLRYTSADEHGPRYREEELRSYGGRPPERSHTSGHRPDTHRDHLDRDQDYRPMTGDYGRASSDRYDRDEMPRARGAAATGATVAHDRHYSEWRQRQIDEIDRDYEDYRREHQSKFESDFSNWRSTRQAKRQLLGTIKPNMQVFGLDEQPVGTVDQVRGDRLVLARSEDDAQHHSINCAMIDRVEGDRVYLDKNAEEAKAAFGSEERDRALYERDDKREPGAHILNRSFSGTY